jgi:hypothetical protein
MKVQMTFVDEKNTKWITEVKKVQVKFVDEKNTTRVTKVKKQLLVSDNNPVSAICYKPMAASSPGLDAPFQAIQAGWDPEVELTRRNGAATPVIGEGEVEAIQAEAEAAMREFMAWLGGREEPPVLRIQPVADTDVAAIKDLATQREQAAGPARPQGAVRLQLPAQAPLLHSTLPESWPGPTLQDSPGRQLARNLGMDTAEYVRMRRELPKFMQ